MSRKLTEPQARLYAELDAAESGWVAIRGARLRSAEALVAKGKADCIGIRDPFTGDRTDAWHGDWTWTLESTRSDYFDPPDTGGKWEDDPGDIADSLEYEADR